ncbi:hypothetical protein [uncultured Clostridium sp.]|uniref:hypothetical protein n=1 Tax=uncultured Clostridium sp. TaxID=59620 RepID=UPI0028EAE197|nr:hypothetical protein [uncultured Clostridium sp.]
MTSDRIYYCGTTSGINTYTAANNKITAYTEGLTVRVKIGIASTTNINGLGAKTILDSLGNAITSGGLKSGLPYQLCYNGTNFIVLGKGDGGDATAPQVLINKKVTQLQQIVQAQILVRQAIQVQAKQHNKVKAIN